MKANNHPKGPAAPRLPENIEAIYPLTPMQKALLFHAVADRPEEAVYFQQLTWVIRTALNPAFYREAWERVVGRHAALRTFFLWQERDEPLQCVCRRVRVPWTEADWRGAREDGAGGLEAWLLADRRRGFHLHEAPLTRFHLLRIGEEEFRFVWSFHHILMDGWCLPLLISEALAVYRHLQGGPPPALEEPASYRDFVAWSQRQDRGREREIWRRKLAGFTSPTSLRLDPPGARAAGDLPPTARVHLSASVTTGLRTAAQKVHRCTLSALVQAAWALLLRAYSGEDEVVFGVTVAGRPPSLPRAAQTVGLFINTLPARVRARADDPLGALLSELMAQQIERDELCQSSLAEIQAVSEVPPGTPLFESIVVFENYPIDAALGRADDPLAIHDFASYDRTNFPLTLLAIPGERLELKLAGDPARFDGHAIRRMVAHLATLLEEIAARPGGKVADFTLLSPEERAAIQAANRTVASWDLTAPLHARIETQVAANPDAPALLVPHQDGGTVLTYRELNRRANQAAHFLRTRGVRPDEPVGVCLERSAELVVALLAVLKAGGAYVPLDPAYPPGRLRLMVEELAPRVVLTQRHLLDRWRNASCEAVALDDPAVNWSAWSGENPPSAATAENLAYVIYTSGSTGQPKGAMNTHRAIGNRLLWMQEAYGLTAGDRVLQKTPFSFDVSVWEFFWPLMVGAPLVVAEPGGHQDPAYLIHTIRAQAVTTVHFVPSMLRAFLEAPGVEGCRSLRRIICSGEALPTDLVGRFFERLGYAELHNLYGPTEAAVDVTAWPCSPVDGEQSNVPIGRPIANTEIHLLDRALRFVPVDVPGELHIGGVGVGRGYWRRPALTAEKFIPDPFSAFPGARLYRTGDLARRRADGAIEYLDRLDRQVKIRGFRVELAEIEARLANAPGVRECAVVAVGEGAQKRLAAYVATAGGPASPEEDTLRRFLREHLPEYMVPATFLFLLQLPLSANGKLDRRALPPPDAAPAETNFAPPQSEAERHVAAAWREVLRVDRVGLYDNFFELGGNSLLLLSVQHRLQRLFGRAVPLPALFRAPTVRLLAAWLTAEADETPQEEPGADAGGVRDRRVAQTARLRGARLAAQRPLDDQEEGEPRP